MAVEDKISHRRPRRSRSSRPLTPAPISTKLLADLDSKKGSIERLQISSFDPEPEYQNYAVEWHRKYFKKYGENS